MLMVMMIYDAMMMVMVVNYDRGTAVVLTVADE